jgi:mannose-6-phosphate isomerase-like protein (cupin superfamily)
MAVTLCFEGRLMLRPTQEQNSLRSEPNGTLPIWVDFQGLQPVACPCGLARRAFQDQPDVPYTMHVTEILNTAKPHYHKLMTETYFILECDSNAFLELDGRQVPVVPGLACLIPPGVVHRGIGRMKVLIVVTPKFDSSEEFVVE